MGNTNSTLIKHDLKVIFLETYLKELSQILNKTELKSKNK